MGAQTIEEMFGLDDEGRVKCPLPADERVALRDALDVLLVLRPEDRQAVAKLTSFLVSAPAHQLQHDETIDIEEVRYLQGKKRGLDDFTTAMTPAALRGMRDWLKQHIDTKEQE